MFVWNFKLDSKNILKIIFVLAIIIATIFFVISAIRIFNASNVFVTNDEIPSQEVYTITANNYTNILQAAHENLNTYIGQQISFEGYIYKVPDIRSNQFILARDMIISSNLQTLVVGFLCELEDIEKYANNSWIKITGEIQKGYYNGDIPIVKILSIKSIDKPSDEFVYPPDNAYLQTSTWI